MHLTVPIHSGRGTLFGVAQPDWQTYGLHQGNATHFKLCTEKSCDAGAIWPMNFAFIVAEAFESAWSKEGSVVANRIAMPCIFG